MRISLFAIALAVGVPASAADPPSKRGGLFNFRSSAREQISAGLFPDSGGSSGQAAPSSQQRSSNNIFRGDGPQKVEPVSYVIENGRRVEKPITASLLTKQKDKPAAAQPVSAPEPSLPAEIPVEAINSGESKRGGFFSFMKRGNDAPETNPVVPPVPTPSSAPAPPAAAPAPPRQGASAPLQAAPLQASPIPAPTEGAPSFAEDRKEGGLVSWIPFLNRKKVDEPAPTAPAGIPTAAPVAEEVAAVSPPSAKPTPKPKPKPVSPPAASEPKPTAPEVATFEIRRDESKPVESKPEKTSREGGILSPIVSPIAKIRPPRKPVDLSGAETIIQDGEIVGESETSFPATAAPTSSEPRQAPQIVNGVKTYSSWDDVDARSSSAADRIINRIR